MVFQTITPVNSIKNNKTHKIQGKLDTGQKQRAIRVGGRCDCSMSY